MMKALTQCSARWEKRAARSLAFLLAWVVGLAMASTTARGQLSIPSLEVYGQTDSSLLVTPTIAWESVAAVADSAFRHMPMAAVEFEMRDSLERRARTMALRWLGRFPQGFEPRPTQREPYLRLLVAAGHDSLAQRELRRWLATPGATVRDQACALYTAVVAFADPLVPARMTLAEAYLKQLHELGPRVRTWQYSAEVAMLVAYDDAAQPEAAIKHEMVAVHLTPLMPLKDRESMLAGPTSEDEYIRTITDLASISTGTASSKQINAILTPADSATPDSLAMDEGFKFRFSNFQFARKMAALVGTTPGPIPSNRWLNRPDSTPARMAMNDGIVRVVFYFKGPWCVACVREVLHLQTVADQDSALHPVVITTASRLYGNREVSPDSGAAVLTSFMLQRLHFHYPVALWIPTTSDSTVGAAGGPASLLDSLTTLNGMDSTFAGLAPGVAMYGLGVTVVDGHGVIRGKFPGVTPEMIAVVHRLAKEMRQAGRQSASLPAGGTHS